MEMVTTVDENDNVIGSMERKQAWESGTPVRIAAIIIFNSKGNLILQKISKYKKHDPLKWTYSAAGHVDADESYEVAATREAKEELGIEGELDSHIGKVKIIRKSTGKLGAFHNVFKMYHDGPFTIDPEETDSIAEFSPTELIKMIRENPDNFNAGLLQILSLMDIK
ncbi:MAG: NUDIX domain-containing protein [Lactobacillus sp.]|jgi:isopentenyldiphosphate isomerase|nr:NUDIX domain-containing protein [Lactobacillus sp.]